MLALILCKNMSWIIPCQTGLLLLKALDHYYKYFVNLFQPDKFWLVVTKTMLQTIPTCQVLAHYYKYLVIEYSNPVYFIETEDIGVAHYS